MCDVHKVVVDNIGEMICRESVGFYYDRVAFVLRHIILCFAVNNIIETGHIRFQFESESGK